LSCGALTVIARELFLNDQPAGAVALVRDCIPLVDALIPRMAAVIESPKDLILRAAENRFRFLPFLIGFTTNSSHNNTSMLSVSSGSDIFPASSPDSAVTPSFPATTDPLAVLLANAKVVSSSVELSLFAAIRTSSAAAGGGDQNNNNNNTWRSHAVAHMSLSSPSAAAAAPPHLLETVIAVMRAVGVIATCLFPSPMTMSSDMGDECSDGTLMMFPHACTEAHLEEVVVGSRKTYSHDADAQHIFDVTVILELIWAATVSLEHVATPVAHEDSPTCDRGDFSLGSSSGRLARLSSMLSRWNATGTMQVSRALETLAGISEPFSVAPSAPCSGSRSPAVRNHRSQEDLNSSDDPSATPSAKAALTEATNGHSVPQGDLYTVTHNFMCEVPWRSVLLQLQRKM
jgi:hypothetical protein